MFQSKWKYLSMILCASTLMACSESPSSSNAPVATQASSANTAPAVAASAPVELTINVGIDMNYPPYDYRDEQGQATGFDVDILKAIAQNQKIGLTIIPERWDKLMANFDNQKYDVAISGFYPDDERKEKYLLSNTYAMARDVILVKDSNTNIKSFDDLKDARVATQANSPYESELVKIKGQNSPTLITENTTFLTVSKLAKGEVDAVLGEQGAMQHYTQTIKDMQFKFVGEGEYFEPYELVILIAKGKPELQAKINAGLSAIAKDGTYQTIYKKWFGTEPTFIPK